MIDTSIVIYQISWYQSLYQIIILTHLSDRSWEIRVITFFGWLMAVIYTERPPLPLSHISPGISSMSWCSPESLHDMALYKSCIMSWYYSLCRTISCHEFLTSWYYIIYMHGTVLCHHIIHLCHDTVLYIMSSAWEVKIL